MDALGILVRALIVLSVSLALLYASGKVLTVRRRRRVVERVVIGQIATVVRQNLPLTTALQLAAESEPGRAGTQLKRIAACLAHGAVLGQAVRLGFPTCSALVVSLITAGERAQKLPSALDHAEQLLVDRDTRQGQVGVSVWPYALAVLSVLASVWSVHIAFIVPRYREIMLDFDVPFPRLLSVLSGALSPVPLYVMSLTVPALPVVLLLGLYFSLRPRRLPEPSLTSKIADWLRWYTPGLRRLERGRNLATLLRTIRLAVDSGMDLAAAARLASDIDVNTQLRRRTVRFADRLAAGTPPRQAATEAELGEVTSIALASGHRTGNLDHALRYAADYHDALVSRWWFLLRSLAWPVSTLILAGLVGVIVYALFEPLVMLIDASIAETGIM